MNKGLIIGLILVLAFIISCTQPQECPTCEEKKCPEVTCPAEKEVTKYVCQDNSIVDKIEDCGKKAAEDKLYTPITTNEAGSYINGVTIKSGCYRGMNTAVMSFDIGVLADKINFQVKESPDEEFKTLYEMNGVNKATRYAIICDNCYSGDFQLKNNKQYLARIEFDLTSLFKTKQYSNEQIIDTRATSEFMTKICSQ